MAVRINVRHNNYTHWGYINAAAGMVVKHHNKTKTIANPPTVGHLVSFTDGTKGYGMFTHITKTLAAASYSYPSGAFPFPV